MQRELTQYVRETVRKQNERVKVWDEMDTKGSLIERIFQEGVVETWDAVEKCMIGAPPEFLISEIGDTLYLCEKYEQTYGPLPPILIQIQYVAFFLCDLLNLNPNDAVMMKWFRNDVKYLRSLGNNGFTPDQYVNICKFQHKARGGDESVYTIWEEMGEDIYHEEPKAV